jgi:hypothetical protein
MVFNPGEIVQVSSRRFDTDAVLKLVMEGDKHAFEAFYERYRGRIYRFMARQFGTGDYGKAAYYSAWRHLVVSVRDSNTPKDLKFSFYQNLGRPSQVNFQQKHIESQTNYLPRDIEEDGKWSLIFIEQFRLLPESMKKRFLFKHEIGLSINAIARIFDNKRRFIEKSIEEAEHILRLHMSEAGCPEELSLDKLYRESRMVKPPATWDKEILDSFEIWLKQTKKLSGVVSLPNEERYESETHFVEKINDWVRQLKQLAIQHKHKSGGKAKKN